MLGSVEIHTPHCHSPTHTHTPCPFLTPPFPLLRNLAIALHPPPFPSLLSTSSTSPGPSMVLSLLEGLIFPSPCILHHHSIVGLSFVLHPSVHPSRPRRLTLPSRPEPVSLVCRPYIPTNQPIPTRLDSCQPPVFRFLCIFRPVLLQPVHFPPATTVSGERPMSPHLIANNST